MPALRVAVMGGGPAGLVFAQLIKLRKPSYEVTLFERQSPESSYGYGVGLGWKALSGLEAGAPQCAADLKRAARELSRWAIRRDDETISAHNSHGVCISRQLLLETLRDHAIRAGVDVRVGTQVSLADVADADLVVAADGVGSETRSALANELGVTVTAGELAYLWCGADIAREEMTFAFARTPAGPMVAHVMPYSENGSTFQVDAMVSTVRALEQTGGASIAYLEGLYGDMLGGTSLHAKRAEWQVFETVTCQRWSHRNVVLVGDAAHTAHYTVGSGTGLAVEDAVCLAGALDGAASLDEAFEAYTADRQPRVRKLQERAARSHLWWSSMSLRIDEPLSQVLLSYLSRTGAVPLAAIAADNAELIDQVLPGVRDAKAILATPFEGHASRVVCGLDAPTLRIEGSPTLDSLRTTVEQARTLAAGGASLLRLAGPPGFGAVLDRLEVAEHVRAGAKVSTVVAGSEAERDALALGVLTGRTDLVEIT